MRVKDPVALKRRRKNQGYSQAELAFLVRRSQATISLIERGEMKTMSEDLALLICSRLKIDWEDYFLAEEQSAVPDVASEQLSSRKNLIHT